MTSPYRLPTILIALFGATACDGPLESDSAEMGATQTEPGASPAVNGWEPDGACESGEEGIEVNFEFRPDLETLVEVDRPTWLGGPRCHRHVPDAGEAWFGSICEVTAEEATWDVTYTTLGWCPDGYPAVGNAPFVVRMVETLGADETWWVYGEEKYTTEADCQAGIKDKSCRALFGKVENHPPPGRLFPKDKYREGICCRQISTEPAPPSPAGSLEAL